MNQLYYGDCLQVMQQMAKDSVDLIYLDPPFNSNRAYNAIYKDETGRPLPDQIEAFCDLWTLNAETERAIRTVPKTMLQEGIDGSVVKFWQNWMNALRDTDEKLLAYLSYMTERLLQMKILLRPTGSIYLHCDPTASHYIKVVMDGVFGHENFRNEIIWCYTGPGNAKRWFPRKHDCLLFYVKSDEHATFNSDSIRIPYKKLNSQKGGGIGGNLTPESIAEYEKQGKIPEDYWLEDRDDMSPVGRRKNEYLGYPTQKPLSLLQRIIRASSNTNDVVFDPFCGCGTTLHAAQLENRKWIGIDIAIHAIKRVSAVRLQEKCHLKEDIDYEISGIPQSIEGAKDLHKRDPYQFQKWAVEMVEGFVTAKRSNDGGVDGRIYFPDGDELKAMKLEVKGTKTIRPESLRALAGIIDEQDFPLGGFITLTTPKRIQRQHFEDFCRTKGTITIDGKEYPRLQVLCVEEILEGKMFETPLVRGKSTTDQLEMEML